MKKVLVAASAALVASAPAFAADLGGRPVGPSYSPPRAALFNWAGFYVGGHAGWGWGSALGGDPSGYLLGLQAGYNFQFASGLLAGLETDISISGMDRTFGGTRVSIHHIGTLRGRVGATMDRVLFYGTGGLAYGRGEVGMGGLSNTQAHVGWTLGLGVEAMVAPHVTARLEYLYANLGSRTYTTVLGPTQVRFDANMLRAGMNYKF
jgi:outer membrane immunogenic protein